MKVLFLMTLALAALMPAVPDPTDPIAIAFACVFTLLFLSWIISTMINGSSVQSSSGTWLILFLTLVTFSLLPAIYFETPFTLWLRGAIPFFFLLIYFPAVHLAARDPNWVLDVLLLSAVIWLINTWLAAYDALPQVLSGEVQRITHATDAWSAFQLPYAMVGLILVLLHKSRWFGLISWPLALLFSCTPLLAVSRGQIAAIVAIWVVYLLRSVSAVRLGGIVLAALSGMTLFVLLFQTDLLESLTDRLAKTGEGDNSRWLEIEYAFAQFLDSPLIGKGLGYQIPVEVTFAGDVNEIIKSEAATVGYMHNVIAYLLMNLGILGLIAYLGFIMSAIYDGKGAGTDTDVKIVRLVALAAVIVIFGWWFMLQPSFRHIQSNLLLAVMLASLAALKAKLPRGVILHARPA